MFPAGHAPGVQMTKAALFAAADRRGSSSRMRVTERKLLCRSMRKLHYLPLGPVSHHVPFGFGEVWMV